MELQEVIRDNQFTLDEVRLISLKTLDLIIFNFKKMTKLEIMDRLYDLRDKIDRFC